MEINRRIILFSIIAGMIMIGYIQIVDARPYYIMNLLLRSLHDVSIINPINGQVLTYDANIQKWTNADTAPIIIESKHTNGTSLLLTNVIPNHKYVIMAKGDLSALLIIQTVHLRINNTIVDTVNNGGVIATIPFTLIHEHTATDDSNLNITVTTTGGTLSRVKIEVLHLS